MDSVDSLICSNGPSHVKIFRTLLDLIKSLHEQIAYNLAPGHTERLMQLSSLVEVGSVLRMWPETTVRVVFYNQLVCGCP